jgi:putative peptidoglycan lipid II flippase
MSLIRSVASIGGYTMMSRVLGFARDALVAAALGAGPVSDAFFVATRLPNMFRTLFAEGAFNAAFVPMFAGKVAAEGEPAARLYAEQAFALLLGALLVTTILAEIFMPWLIPAIAAGFEARPGQADLAMDLARITFPYLLFIALVSLLGGVLNSLGRFAAVAATPVLLNLFQIGAIFWGWRFGHTVEALCWGFTAGGVAQFLWLYRACIRRGMPLRPVWPRLTPDMRRFLGLMLPGVFGAGATQINLLVSTQVASLLPEGSISYLQYADRLNQLPLAVVGIAVGTAILPQLSRQLRQNDAAGANDTQNRGLELALLLTLPAAVALAVIAEPILAVLFQRGHFDAVATHATAQALAVYAAGLPAFVLIKVLAPAFYARQNTKTPVKIAAVAVIINLVLTIGLSAPLLHVGNATATTVAGWFNALALGWMLHRAGHFSLDARARRRVPRIMLAAIGMGAVLWFAGTLTALILLGLASFGALALAFGACELGEVKRLRRRRQAA